MAHKVKNPNGLEANHLAIYKRHQGDKLGITENKSSNREGVQKLNLEPSDFNN